MAAAAPMKPAKSSFASAVFDGAGVAADEETHKGPLDIKAPPKEGKPVETKEQNPSDEKPVKQKPVETKPVETKPVEETPKSANPNLSSGGAKPVEAEIKRPPGMDDKAFGTWKTLHAAAKERDTLKGEVETLRARLEEASKPNPKLTEYEKELATLKKTVADYEGELSVKRIEGTKVYKDTIAKPLKAIGETMEKIAKRYDLDPKVLMNAISIADEEKRAEEIENTIADMKRVDQLSIAHAADEYARTMAAADEMRKDASTRLAEIERGNAAQSEREAQDNKALYRDSAMKVWERRLAETPTVRKVSGQDAWNAILDADGQKVADIDPNNLDLADVAEWRASHAIVTHLESSVTHLQNENKRISDLLKAEVDRNKSFIAQSPAAGGGHSTGGETGGNGSKPAVTLADTMPKFR